MVWMAIAGIRSLAERNPRAVSRTAAVLAVDSIVVNGIIKSIFRRSRPVAAHPHPHFLRIPRTSSFPSGHATSAFCAAALLADGRPMWPAYYGLATLVAASRIHVRIHHASDVVAGVILGTVMGRIARRILPIRESRPGVGVFGETWPEHSPSTGTTDARSPATPMST